MSKIKPIESIMFMMPEKRHPAMCKMKSLRSVLSKAGALPPAGPPEIVSECLRDALATGRSLQCNLPTLAAPCGAAMAPASAMRHDASEEVQRLGHQCGVIHVLNLTRLANFSVSERERERYVMRRGVFCRSRPVSWFH